MKNKVVIGGRYQYSPAQCLKQNDYYSEFRAYDKVTKRDLILQIHRDSDDFIEKLRDIKHAFLQQVFDIVQLNENKQVGVLFESGSQATLTQVLKNNNYLMESDALVILKYAILAVRELHEKMIISNRVCTDNILFCTHSVIKLGNVSYPGLIPMEFQSPEVLREERSSYPADVFSLGVIFYKMLYGCYPFEGDSESDFLSAIKSRKLKNKKTTSPMGICVSKQTSVLVNSMLDYLPENRPTLDSILASTIMSFPVETDLQAYVKPKGSIIPEPFLKKYLVFRASKTIQKYDEYYEESCYLALNIKDKQLMTMYAPDIKMVEADPRVIESYYEKLRAIKESYLPETCEFLCRIDDYERFRREPIIVTEYCNQGDLLSYLNKRQKKDGWFKEKQINIIMYLMALGYKQMRDLGVTSIHTVNCQRIMIRNSNIKIREPGLITPYLQNKLLKSVQIDYFAPELKEKSDFVELDKSDMWSYGVLYYYLIRKSLPAIDPETSMINIEILDTSKKNKNLIGRCLDQDVKKRLTLEQIKIDGVDQDLLEEMIAEKKEEQKRAKQNESDSEEEEGNKKNQHVIFKSRKKKWCKNYNKIISRSSTKQCRMVMKALMGLIILWVVFFGKFFINGGMGMLRTNYYRKITLEVPYNYATSLINITILSTDGEVIEKLYSDYSYQKFTIDLNCTENNHTGTGNSTGYVYNYINYSHSVQCLFGFFYLILFSICFAIVTVKLDLPTILTEKKEKNKDNKDLYHLVAMFFFLCALLFCFFYIFALEYMIQMQPCFGIENRNYPKFTSVETLLNGDVGRFFMLVFPTVILWAILMFIYVFTSLLAKKVNSRIYDKKIIIPTVVVMFVFTLICRIGFGESLPIEPTWSYKMNRDIVSQYWGLFGLFPEVLMTAVFVLFALIDVLFWFFLRLGMEPTEQQDIRQVEFKAKLESISESGKQLERSQTNINMIENQFQIFD